MSRPPATPPGDDPRYWTSPFEELLGQPSGTPGGVPGAGDVRHPEPVFGTPGQDAAFWEGRQSYPDDCAVKCQQFVLGQFTGHHVDEGALVREAAEHGWYTPGGGTRPEDVGKLLELHGVAVHRYEHADQFHLAQELAQGHKVIVGVEAARLWEPNPVLDHLRDALGLPGHADHAVVVSGIDTSDPRHVLVAVSDPGTGQPLAVYPMEQFLDAWRGSDFFLVATRDPAPPHLPEMAHFAYGLGHVPEIAAVPYEQFLEYADHPHDWQEVVRHYVETHPDVPLHHGFGEEPGIGGHPIGDTGHPGTVHDWHDVLTDHPLHHPHGDDPAAGHHGHGLGDPAHDCLPGHDAPDPAHGHLDATDYLSGDHPPGDLI
jgi:hypothetical protein